MRFSKILSSVILLYGTVASPAYLERMSSSELLEKLEQAINSYTRIRTKAETLTMAVDSSRGNAPLWYKQISDFRYDGERYDIIRRVWFRLSSEDAPTPASDAQNDRQLWDGKTVVSHWLFDGDDMKNVKSRIVMSEDEQTWGKNTPYTVGAPLIGILGGDLRCVTEILKEADRLELRKNMEEVSGSVCYVIEASGRNGQYRLWVDPEHGHNIAKAQVLKRENDIAFGEPVTAEKDLGPRSENDGVPIRINKYDFELKNVRFEQIDGKWVPVEADFEYEIEYSNGNTSREKRHHKRTLTDINPDFEAIGAFKTDLANGTRITIPEAAGIIYTWQDGELVPDLDSYVPEMLDFVVEQVKTAPAAEAAADILGEAATVVPGVSVSEANGPASARKYATRASRWGLLSVAFSPHMAVTAGALGIVLIIWAYLHRQRREQGSGV